MSLFESFYCPTSARLARRFPWHVLSKQRLCPLIPGFSSIRAWVTQPYPLVRFLDQRRVPNGHGEGPWYSTSYKETRALLLSFNLKRVRPSPRVPTPKAPDFRRFGPSTMSGSDLRGRWMPSSVTEEDVLKLREARFLTGEISHRLPAQG